MASTARRLKALAAMVGTMGLGFGLWALMTPNEEQLKARAKELPRSGLQHQADHQRLNAEVMAIIKEAAETNENVARRTWPWKK